MSLPSQPQTDIMLDTDKFVQHVPKLENHIHLDGSWDTDVLFDIMKKVVDKLPEKVEIPGTPPDQPKQYREIRSVCKRISSVGELKEYVCIDKIDPERTLPKFLAPFIFFAPIVKTAHKEDDANLEKLAYQFAVRQKQSNVVYTEVRYSPHLLLEEEDLKEPATRYAKAKRVTEVIEAGIQRGSEEFGITIKTILCAICWNPEWSEDLPRLVEEVNAACKTTPIVSLDVAAGELHFDVTDMGKPHQDALNTAFSKLGKHITIHAGESTGGSAEHVRQAIADYSAIRIGHGYKIFDNLELLERCIPDILKNSGDARMHRRLHFEGCPTSSFYTGGFHTSLCPHTYFNSFSAGSENDGNKRRRKSKDGEESVETQTGWEAHPVKRLYEKGYSVGINTDDPSVMEITLNTEWELCLELLKFTKSDMYRITMMQLESMFCTAEEKERVRKRIDEYYRGEDLLMEADYNFATKLFALDNV